jgi:hypothetical protein
MSSRGSLCYKCNQVGFDESNFFFVFDVLFFYSQVILLENVQMVMMVEVVRQSDFPMKNIRWKFFLKVVVVGMVVDVVVVVVDEV